MASRYLGLVGGRGRGRWWPKGWPVARFGGLVVVGATRDRGGLVLAGPVAAGVASARPVAGGPRPGGVTVAAWP
ncbi:hypothetical protein [Micromonospora sp. DH14]|uniref:hypothetical protein n=1 Tax=Micromonospora sp. DH14 TaxID=3040120 RepID=UPI00244155EB|nr:hypothetical protein [Micromonospora sp. DH14]MDG9678827.1 hypothetical protein [Micromonospora sp. DH14]